MMFSLHSVLHLQDADRAVAERLAVIFLKIDKVHIIIQDKPGRMLIT